MTKALKFPTIWLQRPLRKKLNSWVESLLSFITKYPLVFLCTLGISGLSCFVLEKWIVIARIKPIKKELKLRTNQEDVQKLINRNIKIISDQLNKLIKTVDGLHHALISEGMVGPDQIPS